MRGIREKHVPLSLLLVLLMLLAKLLTFDLETSLFSFVCALMEDPRKRITLNFLPTDSAISWMRYLYDEHNKK